MDKIQRSTRPNPTKTTTIDIPDWLLFEVLLLLPLKSVFKCRLVSKRWLSAASDPHFIRAYASRVSSLSPPHWIALSTYVSAGKSFRPALEHNPSNSLNLRDSYLRPPPLQLNGWNVVDHCSIAGSSDGLVLYCYTPQTSDINFFDFCVCNPIIGHRVRPSGHIRSHLKPAWGFTLKSYRIVHAVQSAKEPGSVTFSVYRSEMGAWIKFTVALGKLSCRFDLQESAAALDGILYWAETRRCVIALDPEAKKPERQVQVIRGPYDDERLRSPMHSRLCVAHRGELRYFGGNVKEYDGILGFRVWKLDSGEWSLVHKIDNIMGPEITTSLYVMCFDPLDSDKVYLVDGYGECALSYDMERGAFDDGREMIVERARGFCASRFSKALVLVAPPWPTHVS